MLLQKWCLPRPNIIISVTGGAGKFDTTNIQQRRFKRGIIRAAEKTGAFRLQIATKSHTVHLSHSCSLSHSNRRVADHRRLVRGRDEARGQSDARLRLQGNRSHSAHRRLAVGPRRQASAAHARRSTSRSACIRRAVFKEADFDPIAIDFDVFSETGQVHDSERTQGEDVRSRPGPGSRRESYVC